MDALAGGIYAGGLPVGGGGNPGKKAMKGMEPYGKGGGGPTYSGGTVGSTIPGQQYADGQQLIAQGNAQMATNSPFSPEQQQATQQAYQTANANYVSESTPMARQSVIDQGTNLGAMQGNYNDLAQKLASYDSMVLKPEFEGQNPGMPTDMPYNPDVYKANVSYLTPESAKLPYQQGIYNANPGYAISAQTTQKNSIIDVLNLLNDAMSKELGRGKDIYGSRMKTAAATLEGLGKILGFNADLEMKNAELALRREEIAASKLKAVDDKFQAYAERVKDDLQAGRYSSGNPLEAWGKAFKAVKSQYPQYSDDEINAALGGRAYQDETGQWVGEGNAAKDTLLGLGRTDTQKGIMNTALQNISFYNRLMDNFSNSGSAGNALLGNLAQGSKISPFTFSMLTATDPAAANYIADKEAFVSGLKNLVGESGVLTNQDVERISRLLPNLGDDKAYATKRLFQSQQELKRSLARNRRVPITLLSPDGTQALSGSPNDSQVDQLLEQGWEVVDF